MGTLRKGLNKVLEFVCCTLLALMTIFATWQVASRYVFNNPSTVTEELVLICFVWMGLLGAAYLFGKQEHMAMTFLFDKLSDNLHIPLPKGANQEVDKIGIEIVEKYGKEKLFEVAKLNFMNTNRILKTNIM